MSDIKVKRGTAWATANSVKAVRIPRSVQDIADVIGLSKTLHLIDNLPTYISGIEGKKGKKAILYVPNKLPVTHKLVEILGYNDALRMVKAFGGEILYPANCKYLRKDIADMIKEGTDLVDLAGISQQLNVTCDDVMKCAATRGVSVQHHPHSKVLPKQARAGGKRPRHLISESQKK